ncbi:hypothetical protein J3R30DRAFT_712255 [Lentinula aciculospora]|uniref:Uncharacterized protein n=1 Tax=Lentinula aciculospora TaxID=153920 RepID=A0A9W9A3L7_9AGAR|nr:hypothetical protein J3R30DRAFT_712255 [Lentinula aciculospora]
MHYTIIPNDDCTPPLFSISTSTCMISLPCFLAPFTRSAFFRLHALLYLFRILCTLTWSNLLPHLPATRGVHHKPSNTLNIIQDI